MLQTHLSQMSGKMKGRAPDRMDQALPSTNPHNDCNDPWIRFFAVAHNAQNNMIQQLL